MYHVENEIQVRAANIVSAVIIPLAEHCILWPHPLQVRAAEVLFKMVSDLKEYLILNDFTAINDTITHHTSELHRLQSQSLNELQHMYKDYHQQALPGNQELKNS